MLTRRSALSFAATCVLLASFAALVGAGQGNGGADRVVLPNGVVVTTIVRDGVTIRTAVRPPADDPGSPAVATAAQDVGKPGTETALPFSITLGGQAAQSIGVDRNPAAGVSGNSLRLEAGSAATGGTDLAGGELVLGGGLGTGLGGGGNLRVLTAGANATSGTTDNTYADRVIIVARPKPLTLSAPGFASLMSILLSSTLTAGGRINYVVRATDGGSQIATELGVIQYLATANSITCTTETTEKMNLGTVNSGCTPGFYNPGSHPGVAIFDNVTFSSPSPIVVHEVYFSIENQSGTAIRLEP